MEKKRTGERFTGDVIGARQVAEMLCICEKTVTNLSNKGVIPHTKIGRIYRYSRKQIGKLVPSEVNCENGTLSEGVS